MATIRILCVERVDLLFFLYKKYKKRKGKHDKDDDIPFSNSGRCFLFGGEYDILSLNREEKTSSHQENNT